MTNEFTYLGKPFKTKESVWQEAKDWPNADFDEEWFAKLFKDLLIKMKEADDALEGLNNHFFLRELIRNLQKMHEEIEKNRLTARTLLNSVKEVESNGFCDFTYKKKNE